MKIVTKRLKFIWKFKYIVNNPNIDNNNNIIL